MTGKVQATKSLSIMTQRQNQLFPRPCQNSVNKQKVNQKAKVLNLFQLRRLLQQLSHQEKLKNPLLHHISTQQSSTRLKTCYSLGEQERTRCVYLTGILVASLPTLVTFPSQSSVAHSPTIAVCSALVQ